MRALRIHNFGGPEVLQLDEVPQPEPSENQALVRVMAAGINFIDIYQRSGLYKVPFPYTPGMEGAGTVEKAGPGCDLTAGSRVAWAMAPGAYAEYATVPAARLVPIPDGVGFDAAAAVMLQGMTAHYLSESTFPAKSGDVAVVHAGAGGTGLILIQLLKSKGATVYTTVSTPEKAKLAEQAGADETILYKDEDFVARVKELTGGRGVNVVYDSVGLTTYQGGFEVLRPRGMLVLFGQSSGKVPPIDPIILFEKGSLFLTRPSLAHHSADRQELLHRSGTILGLVRDGKLRLRIEKRYLLEKVFQAHRDLESRATTGKLIVEVAT
ncbi:MAG TPA: quinone oxidoreductase [Chthoniobacterales bacterium]|nr:quinone oxidoreductase [Chthoniobacterales bacterium]